MLQKIYFRPVQTGRQGLPFPPDPSPGLVSSWKGQAAGVSHPHQPRGIGLFRAGHRQDRPLGASTQSQADVVETLLQAQ